MFRNFSFRSKLITLLLSAIIGFIVVALVALNSLNSQQTTAHRLQTLSHIEGNLNTLVITMMQQNERIQSVTNNSYQQLVDNISSDGQRFSEKLDADIKFINANEGKQKLEATKESLINYSNTLIDLVKQRKIIGFDIKSITTLDKDKKIILKPKY